MTPEQTVTDLLERLMSQMGEVLKEQQDVERMRNSADPYRGYMIDTSRLDRLRAELAPTFIRAVKTALTCAMPPEEDRMW